MKLKKILPQWISQDFFLDWHLENWHEIYRNQVDLLSIQYNTYSKSLPQVIAFDNTGKCLKSNQIRFQLSPKKFELEDNIETEKLLQYYKKFSCLHRRKLFNDACLRLRSIKLYENLPHYEYVLFQLQEVSYFDYVRTNLCLDAQLLQGNKSLRTKIHIEENNHKLESLEDSFLANVLGINILVLTSDGTLILQQRSSHTLIRPNQICSSVSGTLVKQDIPDYNEEFSLESVLTPFFREMLEEIGVDTSFLIEEDVRFLGVTRELIRGGQPDFFLMARVNLSKTEVIHAYNQATDRFESKSLLFFDIGLIAIEKLDSEDKKSLFCSRLNEFIREYEQVIAVPLWANLALWCKERFTSSVGSGF